MKLQLQKTLEPGRYNCVISRIEESDSKFGPCLKFIYVTDEDAEVSELVNMRYSEKSKLGIRVQEILGAMPDEIDIEELLGKAVVVTLVEKDGSDFAKVSSVKRFRKAKPKPKPEPEHEYTDDDVPFDEEEE